MRKNQLLCGLFFVFTFLACSKDDSCLRERIIYKAKPVITESVNGDSLYVKGYTTCASIDRFKGTFPENIVKEFGLDKKYIYRLYSVKVEITPNYIVASPSDKNTCGFVEQDLLERGCSQSGSSSEDKIIFNFVSYFIHLEHEVNGEPMDRWIPFPPEELNWRCKLFDTEGLKNE